MGIPDPSKTTVSGNNQQEGATVPQLLSHFSCYVQSQNCFNQRIHALVQLGARGALSTNPSAPLALESPPRRWLVASGTVGETGSGRWPQTLVIGQLSELASVSLLIYVMVYINLGDWST